MNLFWRHVSSVFVGAIFVQLIPIIGSLFIVRIFNPGEFGEFSAWLVFVTFMSVVITLRFEAVLVIVEDGIVRSQAVLIVLVVTVIMAAVSTLCLVALQQLPSIRQYLPEQTILIILLVPATLFLALNQVWQAWAAAEGLYAKLITMRFVQALLLVVLQIFIGLKYPNALSLALGFVFASGIAFVWAIMLMPCLSYRNSLKLMEIKKFIRRYRKFPLYALPADSISTAVAQLPVLVVALRFGNEAAGYLALTIRVLGAPAGLVGKAVLDVFKRHAIQNIKKIGNCRELYINTFAVLFLASLIMTVVTIYYGESIFRIAFGSEWITSGVIAIYLLPMFALGLIASPLSYIAYLVEKQYIDLVWQIGLMMVVVVSLFFFTSYEITLISYAACYAGMYLIYLLISFKLSGGVVIPPKNSSALK